MKKIGVVIASIAGIAWLIGVWWSLFNNSNEFVGFITQQNGPDYLRQQNKPDYDPYCNSYLPGDPWLKELLMTNETTMSTNKRTTKDDVKKVINSYLQDVWAKVCDSWYFQTKNSFWYQQSKDKSWKIKKIAKWNCSLINGWPSKNMCIISW